MAGIYHKYSIKSNIKQGSIFLICKECKVNFHIEQAIYLSGRVPGG